ncbi:MAG TPA: hypothetical protein PK977_01395 [Chitinophagaceae bacterium]|nr:hypothetical protein [Chitinophagaceae bacterium]
MEPILNNEESLLSQEEVDQISYIWVKRKRLIADISEKLHSSFKLNRVEVEDEINDWLDFIRLKTYHIELASESKLPILTVLKNSCQPFLDVSKSDILKAHHYLQMEFDYAVNDYPESIGHTEVIGYIVSTAVIKYLNSIPNSTLSRKRLSHRAKINLLSKIGLTEILNQKNVKTASDIGIFLTILLDIEESNARKLAANILEPKSSSYDRYDINDPQVEQEVKEVLKLRLPNSLIA